MHSPARYKVRDAEQRRSATARTHLDHLLTPFEWPDNQADENIRLLARLTRFARKRRAAGSWQQVCVADALSAPLGSDGGGRASAGRRMVFRGGHCGR